MNLFADDERFEYYNYRNQPLSNKWDFGCKMLREIDFDYVFILGSDDIIDNNVFRIYDENMDKNFDIIRETTYFRHYCRRVSSILYPYFYWIMIIVWWQRLIIRRLG